MKISQTPLLCLLLLIPIFCVATEVSRAQGPHGGDIVGDKAEQFEVKVDRNSHTVDVYTLKSKKILPQSVEVTLLKNPGTGETLTLSALKLPTATTKLPHYQGQLSPHAGSYVGIELKFQVSTKMFRTLRRMPKLPEKSHP